MFPTVCLPDSHARYVRRFAEYFSVTALERSSHATATDRAPAPGNLFASLFHVIAHAENATPSVFSLPATHLRCPGQDDEPVQGTALPGATPANLQ